VPYPSRIPVAVGASDDRPDQTLQDKLAGPPLEPDMNKFVLLCGPVLLVACGDKLPTEANGDVAGQSLDIQTAYWGGPFVLLTNAELECKDLAWVERVYTIGEAPTETDLVALQITFNDSDVTLGVYDVTGQAPVGGRFLSIVGGGFTEYPARIGNVEIIDLESGGDASGTFDLTFDDGSLTGSFEAENCSNLKDH
jgi:hypothetical protein